MGYVPQKGKIISGTLQDNIAFGVKHEQVDSDQIHECMRIACVDDFFSDLSDGLQTNLGNDGVNISMGQRQRVLLARELYRDPVVLFLDESTSFLDDTTSRNVLQNLLSTDVTLVCTSHKLWMADLFDSVYEFVGSGPVTLQLQTK